MTASPDRRVESDALHRRVRDYAAHRLRSAAGNTPRDLAAADEFRALAWAIADFQRRCVPHIPRLWESDGLPQELDAVVRRPLADIPLVPVDALRFADVFAFDPSDAECRFLTSGTTSSEAGRHLLRTRETYHALSLRAGRRHLFRSSERCIAVALLPYGGRDTASSLEAMCQRFMEAWDGRGLEPGRRAETFRLDEPGRFLLGEDGVDIDALCRVVRLAHDASEPVLLLTTSFALVLLFDALGERDLPLPPGSIVMPTGGFKGRTRERDPGELRHEIERRLRPFAIIHEYGMTELSSQLYEATHPELGSAPEPRLYLESPTVFVIPTDPVSLLPVADGEVGLASFVDLGNVDSAVRILTQDRVRREPGGVRLLGRSKRARARGCSLSAEALVVGSRRSPAMSGPEAGAEARTQRNPRGSVSESARQRVARLIGVARRVSDPSALEGRGLRRDLVATTQLALEAIEFALSQCLETHPDPSDVERLLASVPPAPRVWVVSSANVFVAAHRAIALGLAASGDVRVRPSRRDPVLTTALHRAAPDLFRLIDSIEPEPGDHVYAYGSDETMQKLRKTLPDDVVFHPHGDGIGVGWIEATADVAQAARGFALDASLFEQRGCLSPRVIGLEPGVDELSFVAALGQCLAELPTTLPRGALMPDEQADVRRFRNTAYVVADAVSDAIGSIIALQREPERVLLPPVGRNLVVVSGPSAFAHLSKASAQVTSVGIAGDARTFEVLRAAFPQARLCSPGEMQRPRFDGPVDRRVPEAPA